MCGNPCSYRCAYGPEDRLHTEKPSQCDRIVKLGCQCRFEYRKLRNDPDVVCIKFEAKRHITRDGRGAHGAWDGGFRDAARAAPKISADIKSWIFSRLQLRLSPVEILAEHRENVLSRMQKEGMGYHTCQDDFLKLLHIQRVVSSVMKGTWKDPVVLRQRARVKQARLRKVMRDWRPTFTFFYPSFQTWTPRKRRRVLQCTDPNTISERRSGAQEDPLELSSSSDEEAEAEAQVAPTDVIPEVSSEPTDLDACLAKGAQAGQNYYASMFLHVKEALKIAETDLANKSSQSNSVLRFPATKRTTLY